MSGFGSEANVRFLCSVEGAFLRPGVPPLKRRACFPEELRARHPELPWRAIMGSGNIYRHNYDNVAHHAVWHTIHAELPALAAVIEEEIAQALPRANAHRCARYFATVAATGRLRTIPLARIASAAEGLAEVEIFAAPPLSGARMRTTLILALDHMSGHRRFRTSCLCASQRRHAEHAASWIDRQSSRQQCRPETNTAG